MIDRFTRQRFEAALPVVGGQPLWQSLSLQQGEYCYYLPVRSGVLIYIRSTVAADNLAADTAKDSIRCWLAADTTGKGLGSKDQRWIARTNGWDKRLTETLRNLWRIGHQLKSCPHCHTTMLALKTQSGENKGKWFTKCPNCKDKDTFAWLQTEKKNDEQRQQNA